MKALFIGGTGTISSAITQLAAKKGWELYLLNRGNRTPADLPASVKLVKADANNEAELKAAVDALNITFDVVADFIAFLPEQVERDWRVFSGKTRQYMFISSASAYQKPQTSPFITESTPLNNPYWRYSRNKAACEDVLTAHYRNDGFPITIIRPSHTYSEKNVPVCIHGKNGSWQVILRMLEGKPVIIPGDGTTLWTLTYNADFAKGFVGLMGNPHAMGEAFHITTDERVTWNAVYQSIARALGVELKPYYVSSEWLAQCSENPDDVRGNLIGDKQINALFDNTKLKRAVPDFVATTRFDEGARLCINYMLAHKDEQTADPDFDNWCDRVIAAQENAKKAMLAK